MKGHFSVEQRSVIERCIEKCEQGITSCQNLITGCAADSADECLITCSAVDTANCAENCGKIVKKSNEIIEACKNTIDQCIQHLTYCHNESCKKNINECIRACKVCVIDAERNALYCKVGDEKCVSGCVKFIKHAQICINACSNCISDK